MRVRKRSSALRSQEAKKWRKESGVHKSSKNIFHKRAAQYMIRGREKRGRRKLIFVSALGEKNDYRDDKFEVRTQMPRAMSAGRILMRPISQTKERSI
jgi:hypothetical protein